jgi:hypothetical protein
MAYIAKDILTQECIGPFETEDDALAFTLEASDILGEEGLAFDIHQIFEPIEWALNNNAEPTAWTEEEENDGNSIEEDRSVSVLSEAG